MMGPGGGGWGGMRSLRRDSSVTQQKLAPGTGRRILRFAAPYKRMLGVFLVLIVIDAVPDAPTPGGLYPEHEPLRDGGRAEGGRGREAGRTHGAPLRRRTRRHA